MTLHPSFPPLYETAPSRAALPRRLALVATGLGALALVAAGAVALWPAAAPAPGVPVGPAPEVWLSNLVATEGTGFAAPDVPMDPVLPRNRAPLPPRPVRDPGAAVAVAQAPADAPRTTDRVGPDGVTPDRVALARPSLPETPPTAEAQPRIVARLETPAVTPPRRAALAADTPAASPRAPTRSPFPRLRPQADTSAAARLAAIEADPELPQGLIRSRTPRARPEAVTRLASLDVTTPTPSATPPAATAPAGTGAPVIEIAPLASAAVGRDQCDSGLTRSIPRRRGNAGDGSAVIGRLSGQGGSTRDDAILAEVLAGNVPDFLRNLVPVTFTGTGPNGQATRITICVTPDYLAVGSNRDFVRVPLGLPAAMRVAERFDMVLPTTRMVDAIYQQASVHLSPAPMEPGAQMSSTAYFLRHNATVQGQLRQAGGRLGQLVAGQKKDLVLTNRLNSNPGRVAIYGWHRRSGAAIQPLSTVHGAQYADYSHGIRLVSRRAFVNGRAVDLRDLLGDSRLAGLVSAEGTITNRRLLASLD
ncbi:MAG: hypothetical protein KDJ96_08480 [Rhodobacteraceae bacterium]|nr:hypothetical protein [Paracoccaceae bacterium]